MARAHAGAIERLVGLRSITPLPKESLRGLKPAEIVDDIPVFELVSPRDIFVEEGYQRTITEAGVGLIRKIYAGFSWARYKPPVCVRVEDGVLVCIDGQHTATAAASHPKLKTIPVMIVAAADAELRAGAFVGHNRERLTLTPMMIYRAELASADPLAQMLDRACRKSGALILDKAINLKSRRPIGETVAIGTLKQVAKRMGEEMLGRVLAVLVAAERGPIKADEVAAVALILHRAAPQDRAGLDERLRDVVKSKSTEAWVAIGATMVAGTREPIASAVARAWCRQLDLRLEVPKTGANAKGQATRLLNAIATPSPPRAKAPPAGATPPGRATVAGEPAKRASEPPPKTQPPAGARAILQPPAPAEAMVHRNGVLVDIAARRVTHRGREIELSRERVALVAQLARVMPGLLPGSILEKKLIARPDIDSSDQIRSLVAATNPDLSAVRLEIRVVPKFGYCLADMGAG